MTGLVFVPLEPGALARWAGGAPLGPSPAIAVTPAFQAAFGFARADDEAAEYTALCVAGVLALTSRPRRLVAVAAADVPATADEFGRVEVSGLGFETVTSIFAEGSAELAGSVHAAVAGRELAVAWDDARVETLLTDGDLLWHGPTEWGTLV